MRKNVTKTKLFVSKIIAHKCFTLFFQTDKQTAFSYSQAVAAYAPIKSDLDICLHIVYRGESKQTRKKCLDPIFAYYCK